MDSMPANSQKGPVFWKAGTGRDVGDHLDKSPPFPLGHAAVSPASTQNLSTLSPGAPDAPALRLRVLSATSGGGSRGSRRALAHSMSLRRAPPVRASVRKPRARPAGCPAHTVTAAHRVGRHGVRRAAETWLAPGIPGDSSGAGPGLPSRKAGTDTSLPPAPLRCLDQVRHRRPRKAASVGWEGACLADARTTRRSGQPRVDKRLQSSVGVTPPIPAHLKVCGPEPAQPPAL